MIKQNKHAALFVQRTYLQTPTQLFIFYVPMVYTQFYLLSLISNPMHITYDDI